MRLRSPLKCLEKVIAFCRSFKVLSRSNLNVALTSLARWRGFFSKIISLQAGTRDERLKTLALEAKLDGFTIVKDWSDLLWMISLPIGTKRTKTRLWSKETWLLHGAIGLAFHIFQTNHGSWSFEAPPDAVQHPFYLLDVADQAWSDTGWWWALFDFRYPGWIRLVERVQARRRKSMPWSMHSRRNKLRRHFSSSFWSDLGLAECPVIDA